MKHIILLHTINHFKKYSINKGNLNQNNSIKIIALTIELRIYLKQKKIQYKIEEDYINEALATKIDYDALDFCEKWHNDLFKFRDISLGLLIRWELRYYIARIFTYIHLLLKIIEIEKPTEIISFNDSNPYIKEFNEVVKYISSKKKINLNLIPIGKSKQPHIFSSKQNLMAMLRSLIVEIQEYKPFKFSMKVLLNLLWVLKNLKICIFNKNQNNILTYQYTYHESIVKEISQDNNLVLLDDQIRISNYKDLFQNLRSLFISRGGYHIFFEMFDSFKIKRQTNLYFRKSLNKWKKIIEKTRSEEIFFYNGISIWPLFKGKIHEIIFSDFKKLINTIILIHRILNKKKYKIIILSNDVTQRSMILAIIASKIGVPTLVIQHGLTGYPVAFFPSFSQKFATWGKISKEWLISHGMKNDKIIITGCPRFDVYSNLNQNEQLKKLIKNSIFKKFRIQEEKKLFVFASVYGDLHKRFPTIAFNFLEIEKTYYILLNIAKNLPKSHLIIKLHPTDTTGGSIPLEIMKNLGIKNVSIIQKNNIIDLIVACDCFITAESTTGVEAMILEKPIIFLNFRETKNTAPYLKYYPNYHASNYEEIFNKIQKIFDEPIKSINYKKFLKDYIYKKDGLSTKRVMDLIKYAF